MVSFPKTLVVLQTFAGQNGVDTDQFNQCQRISGRDFAQESGGQNEKITNMCSSLHLGLQGNWGKMWNKSWTTVISTLGEKIAPKTFRANKIDTSGTLTDISYNVHGRMIPIQKILDQMTEAHKDYQRNNDIINWLTFLFWILTPPHFTLKTEKRQKREIVDTFNDNFWPTL